MDFLTTIIILSLVNLLSGILLLFLYFEFKHIPSTKEWATGGLLVGTGCMLLMFRGIIPDFFSIVIANSAIFFGYAFHYRGFALNASKLKYLKIPFFISGFLTAIFLILMDQAYLNYRIIISSLGILILNIFLANVIVNASRKINVIYKLLFGAVIINATSHFFRVAVYIFQDIYDPSFTQTLEFSNFLIFIVGSFLTVILTAGCSLMISLSLQLRLEDNLEMLKSESDEKTRFLAMFSHELKTPLSVLKSIISSKKITPQFIKIANQSVNEIDTIITSSHLADQIDSDAIKTKFEKVNIKNLVSKIIKSTENKDLIKLQLNHSVFVETDPFLINIILKNLIDNALKYGKTKSQISFSVSNDLGQDYWLVNISNKIPSRQKINTEKLLEKYYREPQSLKKSGSGLGLYLVKGFTEMLNGKINLEVNDMVFNVKLIFFRP